MTQSSNILGINSRPSTKTRIGVKDCSRVRHFSSTNVNYAKKIKCDCCVNKYLIGEKERGDLYKDSKNYSDQTPPPVIITDTYQKMFTERRKNIATAFRDDSAGLEKRLEDINTQLKGIYPSNLAYYRDKYDEIKKSLLIKRSDICGNSIENYLMNTHVDPSRVNNSNLKAENKD